MTNHFVNQTAIVGVDIGGSHITAAKINLVEGMLDQDSLVRTKINPHASADEILGNWLKVLKLVFERSASETIYLAVSMPGPFDYAAGVSLIKGMNKYEALYGLSVKQFFSEQLAIPEEHILFVNDAKAFLKGEAIWGAGRGVNKVFGITLGTGLGSAIYQSGRVEDLNLGSSPFLGGIAEDYISTRGILAYYRAIGGKAASDVKQLTQELLNSSPAEQAMEKLSEWLSEFLIQQLPILKPDVVVVGGNITKAHGHFLPKVIDLITKQNLYTPIKIAKMGEHAAMMGAASFINNLPTR